MLYFVELTSHSPPCGCGQSISTGTLDAMFHIVHVTLVLQFFVFSNIEYHVAALLCMLCHVPFFMKSACNVCTIH